MQEIKSCYKIIAIFFLILPNLNIEWYYFFFTDFYFQFSWTNKNVPAWFAMKIIRFFFSYIFRRDHEKRMTKDRWTSWRRDDFILSIETKSENLQIECSESCRNRDVPVFPSTIIRNIWIHSMMTSPVHNLTFTVMERQKIRNINSGHLAEVERRDQIVFLLSPHGEYYFNLITN